MISNYRAPNPSAIMETTELSLPPELPYPIIVSSIELGPAAQVARGSRLLTYSYAHVSLASDSSETRFGTWDSPIEGTIHSWKIKPGDVISQTRAREPVILVNEPCKHGMQVGGLCGLCGKDMTEYAPSPAYHAPRADCGQASTTLGSRMPPGPTFR